MEDINQKKEAFMDRIVNSCLATFDIYAIYVGDQLGLYRALVDGGPATSAQLAERTGTTERYVREWLEQQAVSGILACADRAASAADRVYSMPEEHAEVLADSESVDFLAPVTQLIAGAMTPRAQVLDAYRTGGGVPYADYGPDLRIGQSRMNRTAFLNLLPTDWFPQITALHVRLQADPPARVADIGFGGAWSCIGIAKGYPKVLVDGFDNDEASVVMARENVEKAELSDRISLHVRDAGDPELAGKYDLVTAFECVHDMSDPVAALSAMRRLANENGTVLIMDERVSDQFADSNEVDQFMYGWSFHHCLPVGMVDKPSAETGTVMRTATLRGYAEEAGFQNFEVLPIDNFFFRFYRLTP